MSGHISPKSVYYTIFGSLMVLTAVTVAVAFINLGALNFPVALGIAILKATLVILFFMHVKYSSRLTNYLSRGWFTAPDGTTGAGTQVTIGPPAPAPAAEEAPAEAVPAEP